MTHAEMAVSSPESLFLQQQERFERPYDAAMSYRNLALQGLKRAQHSEGFDLAMGYLLDPYIGTQIHKIDETARPYNAIRIIGQELGILTASEVMSYADRAEGDYMAGLDSWVRHRRNFNSNKEIREFDVKVMDAAARKAFANVVRSARADGTLHSSPRALVASDAVAVLRTEKYL